MNFDQPGKAQGSMLPEMILSGISRDRRRMG